MRLRKEELIPKPILGPDRGLQLALVKPKSLVVAGHQRLTLSSVCLWTLAANKFLLLAHTARQANRVGFWRALAYW
jgi:hypothetical protein